MDLTAWREPIAGAIETAGVAVIVLGAIGATLVFLNLGRAILLGLELLVAADIIATVAVDPTYESVGVLAVIVLIRTFLSFSLEVEIEGRWPWARTEQGQQPR